MNERTIDRFLTKIESTSNGCWRWKASHTRLGYGCITIGSRTDGSKRSVLSHRLAYQYWIGEIPENKEIDHLCRHRDCVNPTHLEIVDHRTNVQRGLAGKCLSDAGRAKLCQAWARRPRKTICKNGHKYTPANTYWYRCNDGRMARRCKRCAAMRAYFWLREKRQAAREATA